MMNLMNKKDTSLVKHIIAVVLVTIALMTRIPLIFSVILAMNIICFLSFGYDKKAAKKGWGRVPERTYLTLGFLSAFPALLLGRKVFRHKTVKKEFIIPMWGLFILQVGLVGYYLYSL